MKRRRFRQRVTCAIMRLVGAYEASFRQLFGGFLNVKGFYTGFGGFLSHSQHKQNENLGERLCFLWFFR